MALYSSDSATDDIAHYVVDRGIFAAGTPLRVTELTGGVSGVLMRVDGGGSSVVVKRALRQLLVEATWIAKPERALTEAAALAEAHARTPGYTPELLDVDAEALTFTMTAAPADWLSWRQLLFADRQTDQQIRDIARRLGEILGSWHAGSWHDEHLAARFNDYEAFDQLRLHPFHEAIAARHPALRGSIDACVTELRQRRDCLVHGDFSPKNILVAPSDVNRSDVNRSDAGPDGVTPIANEDGGIWVLDFEVAHFGAAVFDVAFMQCHLILKALHLPWRAAALRAAANADLAAYRAAIPDEAAIANLAAQTACLLLARVDGMSPATYLSAEVAAIVRALACEALAEPSLSLDELWQRVLREANRSAPTDSDRVAQ
jgi:aminoglycoside phosphotransferase (APT) family kinase protein